MFSNKALIATIVMMAVFGGIVSRRGAVSAFSFAAYAKARPSTSGVCAVNCGNVFSTAAFKPRSRLSSSMRLGSAVAPTSDMLEKTLEVEHPAYEVLERDVVTEYGYHCSLFRHKKSGAELLSVSSDDDNKVFGISFRTPPDDSTGVPHILEHSVLCGSRKYKTKDPFVQLLQGSLQTFLNAMTFPDRTCYVVASQNLKDFRNLVNVYADAVFHPRAISDPNVYAQEGWHFELEDRDQPLTYKGVVYNEMKGVYSSPDSLLSRESMRSLFPDNAYAVDSGGDPTVIPELSFQNFVDFHQRFYSPSNCRIYFSGDDDVHERLELMDEYLSDFDELPGAKEDSRVAWQPKTLAQPARIVKSFPAGPDQPERHMLTVNWLLNDQRIEPDEELALVVLDHLLMGTSSAVLRKSLMESGLGEAITGRGLSDSLLQATFSVGLKGVAADKIDSVESLVLDTLAKIENEGFDDDDIASAMNSIEFDLREFNTGSFPKGLSFMLGSMQKWNYDESPTASLKFEEPLKRLKAKIKESGSGAFQELIDRYLVRNNHRTTVVLQPSKTMEEEALKDEQERLSVIKASLSDHEVDEILTRTSELKRLQSEEDSPEARATIPTLELVDLKRESTEYPLVVTDNENQSGVAVVRHEMGSTSGIVYATLLVDISMLLLDDVPLLPLFCRMMTENGAGDLDSVALSRKIGTHTGGVGVSLLTSAVHPLGSDESLVGSGEQLITKLQIGGKAVSAKANELFSIFELILTKADFDSQRKVLELLKESRSRLESRIQGAGHSIVNTRMKARYRVGGYLDEMLGGITYLETLKELISQTENDWPSLLARLEGMRHAILSSPWCRDGMKLDLTGDSVVLRDVQHTVESLLNKLPGDSQGPQGPNFYRDVHPWVPDAKAKMSSELLLRDEGFVVPTQVSYVGKSGLLFEEGERIPGSAAVVARFIKTGYLWDHVRVMGGAYGGFCAFSPFSGFFSFLSYRDPNLEKTIDVYDAAADALFEAAEMLEHDRAALDTAIIGAIGDMDGALSPDQKGSASFQRYLLNESPDYRQRYRDEMLSTSPNDFREFAMRLKNMKNSSSAVVSSKGAFEAAEKAGKRFVVTEIN